VISGTGYTYLGTVAVGDKKEYKLTGSALLSYLNTQAAGDQTATFMFIDETSGANTVADIDSREGVNAPYLDLNEAVFRDDFEDGDTVGWTIGSNTWANVTDGDKKVYGNTSATSGSKVYVDATAGMTDSSIEAKAKVDSWTAAGTIGLLARYVDSNHHYFMRYDNALQQVVIGKKINSTTTVIASSDTIGAPAPGTYHTYRLDVHGTTLDAYLDGNLVASGADSTLSSGYDGLFSNGQIGYYDDVIIR
jgi:hypothetical protein